MELSKKNETVLQTRTKIAEEKDRLLNENARMISDLHFLLESKQHMTSRQAYVNYKYDEYGDADKINNLFELWTGEHKRARAEYKTLMAEYEKIKKDLYSIPEACEDIRNHIAGIQNAISVAEYEIEEILKAVPNLEERAKESEEIFSAYQSMHKEYAENTSAVTQLRNTYEKANRETNETEISLSKTKANLATLLKTEQALNEELSEFADRVEKQEVIKEDHRFLKEVLDSLKKVVDEWQEKIKNHEEKSAALNKEINRLKSESAEYTSQLKEYEALSGTYKDLTGRLENSEKAISLTNEQLGKITGEIQHLRKENDILSIKARQMELIKKKMGDIHD